MTAAALESLSFVLLVLRLSRKRSSPGFLLFLPRLSGHAVTAEPSLPRQFGGLWQRRRRPPNA
jgi:hypothetical protein